VHQNLGDQSTNADIDMDMNDFDEINRNSEEGQIAVNINDGYGTASLIERTSNQSGFMKEKQIFTGDREHEKSQFDYSQKNQTSRVRYGNDSKINIVRKNYSIKLAPQHSIDASATGFNQLHDSKNNFNKNIVNEGPFAPPHFFNEINDSN